MQTPIRAVWIALLFFGLAYMSLATPEIKQHYVACEPGFIHSNSVGASISSDPSITERLSDAIADGSLLWPLILAAIAGLLTALSPCVYPLIPVTLSIMGARRYQSHLHGFLTASSYVLGMSLIYTALGATFAYAGILAGSLMQNPVVITAIAALFILLALSMFGLFELALPTALLNRLSRIGGQGYGGAFLMGLVAGLIAAPCTGPVLGFILTFITKSQNPTFGLALMSAFSLGLGLPFLVLGTFSSMILRLPRSGPWMKRIKYFFGIIMLMAAAYYLSLAFRHEPPVSLKSDSWHVLNAKNAGEQDFARLKEQAKSECKAVLVDFYADWCIACKELDEKTFSDKEVQEALQNYFLIRINATDSSSVLNKLQSDHGVTGLPTILFFDRQGTLSPIRILGYLPPDEFLHQLRTVEQSPNKP